MDQKRNDEVLKTIDAICKKYGVEAKQIKEEVEKMIKEKPDVTPQEIEIAVVKRLAEFMRGQLTDVKLIFVRGTAS